MSLPNPKCEKCQGSDFHFKHVFMDDESHLHASLIQQLMQVEPQYQKRFADIFEESKAQIEKIQAMSHEERDGVAEELARREATLKRALQRERCQVREEVDQDEELALIMDDSEIERLVQSRLASRKSELESITNQLETNSSSRLAEQTQAIERKIEAVRSQQVAKTRDFGSRTENDSVVIVYCVKCGHVLGVAPSPAASRSVELSKSIDSVVSVSQQRNEELLSTLKELTSLIRESNQLTAQQQKVLRHGLQQIASILSAPTTSTSVSMELG